MADTKKKFGLMSRKVILGTTLGASLLAKLVFQAAAPWSAVLGFNLIFALAAIAVFRAVAGTAAANVELLKARD